MLTMEGEAMAKSIWSTKYQKWMTANKLQKLAESQSKRRYRRARVLVQGNVSDEFVARMAALGVRLKRVPANARR
jgi:hypothetical protein